MNLIGNTQEKLGLKEFRFLWAVSIFFVSVLLISNVASSKIVDFGIGAFDGGTILFPLAYIFGDVLTEVYGYKRTRKIIWMGLMMNILMVAVFYIVGLIPAASDWVHQDAYMAILGQTPRIVFASVVAYFFGEFSNSYILAKMKVRMNGKKLWVRTISSTVIGELFDTLIFVTIAFYGVLPNELLVAVIISNYIFKIGVEMIFTPVTCFAVGVLKKKEGVDVYDRETNFNPFRIE